MTLTTGDDGLDSTAPDHDEGRAAMAGAKRVEPTAKTQPCPQCGAAVPVDDRFTSWCACGWNLIPTVPPDEASWYARLYARLGQQRGHHLLDVVLAGQTEQGARPAIRAAILLVAAPVLGLSLLGLVGGIALLLAGGVSPLGLLGLLLLAVTYITRPRVTPCPRNRITEDAAPHLHAFVDRVAATLGAGSVKEIGYTADFNASFGRVGWQRHRTLILGVPLVHALDRHALIALVAHELAHDVNGDVGRLFLPSTALRTLGLWAGLLRPSRLARPYRRTALLDDLSEAVMAAVGLIAHAWAALLVHLLWQESQYAEYAADALAARVAGADAMRSLLRVLHCGHVLNGAVRDAAVGRSIVDPLRETGRRIATLPAREVERLDRVARLDGSRLDSTHPPTPYRLDALALHPATLPDEAATLLDEEEHRRILEELTRYTQGVTAALIERYRRSLYY